MEDFEGVCLYRLRFGSDGRAKLGVGLFNPLCNKVKQSGLSKKTTEKAAPEACVLPGAFESEEEVERICDLLRRKG